MEYMHQHSFSVVKVDGKYFCYIIVINLNKNKKTNSKALD